MKWRVKPLRCRYKKCRRPMHVTWESYVQNPYCAACLHERLRKAAALDPVVAMRRDGDYMIPIRRSDIERRQAK